MEKRIFSILLLLTFFTSFHLYAGTTGKITGKVTDKTTGEPLIGANVILKGTSLGAATDVNGNYTILNITGGKYTLVSTMMGYKTVELEEVVVLADHTSKVDIQMEVTAIKGEEVTIIAERPVIVRDETATTATVLAEDIEDMPVNSYIDILDNVAGVIESESGDDQGIHIRGGRSNEIAYMVDGVMVKDAIYGGMGTDVSRSAISELSIITGGFDAEYGEAMSGVVNILTKEGTEDLNASFRVVTDQLGSYMGDPLSDWNTQRLEGSLSGPIPFFPKNSATFFVSFDQSKSDTYLGKTVLRKDFLITDIDGDENYDEGVDEAVFDEYDLDEDGDTTDLLLKGFVHKNSTFRNQDRLNAKLVFRPISSVKLSASGIFNRVRRRGYSMSYKLIQDNYARWWEDSDLYTISLNHSLSSKTFYTVRWSHFYTHSWNGLKKYMNKKRNIWNVKDISKINQYWNPWEPFYDSNGDGKFNWDDKNGNGVWDPGEGEFFADLNGDSLWTEYYYDTGADGVHAETFTDVNGDGTWEPGEDFIDTNGDGIWNGPDEGERDGLPTAGEPGVVDLWWSYHAEPFLDSPDGIYREGSADIFIFDSDTDGVYEPEDGDLFIDLSGDGVWREGEAFVDLDGNGEYNYGLSPPFRTSAFQDQSNYEFYGTYNIYDNNGEFVRETTSESSYYEKYSSEYTSWDGNITSQITPTQQIKMGFEIKDFVLKDFYGTGLSGGIWGLASDPAFRLWRFEPKQRNYYIRDKIEFEDWIINLGLRWEYLDPSSDYPDPTKKVVYRDEFGNFTEANGKAEPFYDAGNGKWDPGEFYLDLNNDGKYNEGEIFTDSGNGVWDTGEYFVDTNGDGTWTGAVAEYGYLDENGNFIPPPKAKKKWRLMPRIGVAYPITDNVKFHFSYGHFLQYPEYKNMYQYTNQGDPSIYGNSLFPFPYSLSDWYIPSVGNPNVKPEITVAYEIGIHWRISSNFLLNTTVFYKDMYDYHASKIFHADPTDYAIFLNQDYGNSRGIEFNLKKLFSHHYSFDVTYTFSRAVGNATDEYSHWWEEYLASVYGTRPSLKTVILDWDQPHTFNFTFNYVHPRGYGINVIGNMGSGLPYTPTDVRGQNIASSNSGRKPLTVDIDMKAYKDFRIDPITLRLFLDITNLINRTNVLNVFSNSGQPDENLNPNASIEWEDRPHYYGPPRHIEAGIEITFE